MARDLGDLAASAKRTADALPTAQKRGVTKAALHTVTLIRSEMRSATGNMVLSGVGKRGAKINARYDVKGAQNPVALIRATGPAHLVERDTSPHVIEPRGRTKTAKGRTRKGAKALKFGGGFYAGAMHPGTRGKHPFEKGWRKAAPQTPHIFQREVREAFKKAWF